MYGDWTHDKSAMPMYPGTVAVTSNSNDIKIWDEMTRSKPIGRTNSPKNKFGCDIVESRPTFVLSNDDIFNLGHYINDVMNIWNMIVLSNIDSKDAVLLNIDGLRSGGPSGGPANRLMVPSSPDTHGPYVGYYLVSHCI